MQERLAEIKTLQLQRERQQGLGRPIVSDVFQGFRIVAVGNQVYYSTDWKTFHDFLFHYITSVMGKAWGSAELAKPESERHPLLVLHALVVKLQRVHGGKSDIVKTAPMTGAAALYLGLAYNLYLLAHNATLQARLVSRLRDPEQFHGALYETYVAAAFIKAGFHVELEEEDDPSTSHCEFSARHPVTKRTYSVEAKSRRPNKQTANVANQLHAALKKRAAHSRVVFIDVNREVNRSAQSDPATALPWLQESLSSMRRKEGTLTVNGAPAPEAYVVLSTHPFHMHLEALDPGFAFAAEGFKIADFKLDSLFHSVREARLARDKHREMYDLLESMRTHTEIPITFDGEIPEFAFGATLPRLVMGRQYMVPGPNGVGESGTLVEATVSESESKAIGVYRLESGQFVTVTCPLTPGELSAYRRHPDTFFGVYRRQGRHAQTPLDLYDFFLESYGRSSKENLLELMRDHPDIEELRTKDQAELAVTYCERMALAAARTASPGAVPSAATGMPPSPRVKESFDVGDETKR